jgi:DNA processing protein
MPQIAGSEATQSCQMTGAQGRLLRERASAQVCRRLPKTTTVAALADVVVVVEATLTGGARITAEHALRYDRPVLAVRGSRRNPAAVGTNALIADGAHPLTDWSDLVLALDMTPGSRRRAPMRPAPGAHGRAVLDALGGEADAPEALVARTGLTPEELALAVRALERDGWVRWSAGLVWPT